jgi:anti-sigma factor (TIGR02949 family)
MNSCSRSASVLSFLIGELDGGERSLFEKHLAGCPICSHELRLELALQNGLAECMLPDTAPVDLRSNILLRILTVHRPRFPVWQIAVTLFSGAAASLALLRVFRDSNLPETAIGLLAGLLEGVSGMIEKTGSLPLMIGTGVILVGIASIVASLLPEE